MSKNIVFVHGFMSTPECWKEWKKYFEKRGYNCVSPSWPYHDRSIEQLQKNPDFRLEETDFGDVLNKYKKEIEKLDDSPILIGHSLGGVVVQKLLEEGYGRCAICINSGPPKGIAAFNIDFLVSNFLLINPFSKRKLRLMGAKWYNKYVTNELTYDETVKFIKENCVPASKKVATTIKNYPIDFSKKHSPLLFIAGENDKSQPPVINKKNYLAYKDKGSIIEFKQFPYRTHNIIVQNNWEEVAEYVLNWISKL